MARDSTFSDCRKAPSQQRRVQKGMHRGGWAVYLVGVAQVLDGEAEWRRPAALQPLRRMPRAQHVACVHGKLAVMQCPPCWEPQQDAMYTPPRTPACNSAGMAGAPGQQQRCISDGLLSHQQTLKTAVLHARAVLTPTRGAQKGCTDRRCGRCGRRGSRRSCAAALPSGTPAAAPRPRWRAQETARCSAQHPAGPAPGPAAGATPLSRTRCFSSAVLTQRGCA